MTKVLLVGLDGATWDIIKPLAASGRLPNLAYLMRRGASGPLRSTIPPVTPAAWTTVFTGKNPGKHGIYDFQELNPQTYEFATVRTDQHHEKTIWQLLTEHGQRSVILDVPFTYPPRPFNGLMLTGYGTPRTPGTVFTFPRDLRQRLPAELQQEIRVALPRHSFDRSPRFIEEWARVMDGRQRLLDYLLKTEAWDFFMVVFSITDNMAHVFWTYVDPAHPNFQAPQAEMYRNALLEAYQQCDRLLGELMEAAGPNALSLVISDHGFGSVRPRQYLFRRLLQGGYVTPQSTMPGPQAGRRLMKLALEAYLRLPILREWAKNLRPKGRNLVKRSLNKAGMMPTEGNIDFSGSQLIPTNFGLRMWVNEQGRFGRGIVPPERKETLLEELEAFLLSDVDPIKKTPVIRAVYRGQDLYHGPYAENCPDVIIEYENMFNLYDPAPPTNPHVEGGHTLEGILLAYGPGVRTGEVTGGQLHDIAPIVLHALGHEIPPDMDGEIPHGLFTESYLAQNPVRMGTEAAHLPDTEVGDGYTEEEDSEIREQLRQLGYL
ncbi:MAG TPA: alkaline phosphatase family protein [Candidatus Sulfomarinibacteraceae bacterium]|nr:alkaline phosphatase family protein [Candidatus Sulfomarinibacteraceae bacterium]